MALTNAERQARYRARKKRKDHPESEEDEEEDVGPFTKKNLVEKLYAKIREQNDLITSMNNQLREMRAQLQNK